MQTLLCRLPISLRIGIVARALVNLKFPRMTQIARVTRALSVEVAVHYPISMPEASGTLQAFAECADAVAATTKKLEKAAILGAYLQSLSDADLTRAARYFAGHQFALADARTTNVGGSIQRRAQRGHGF